MLNQGIDEISDEDLDFFLTLFVAEVTKEDGPEYPGKTIYEMLWSLQCLFRFQRKGPLFLIDKKDCKFRSLNSTLNFVLRERVGERIGNITSKAEVITPEQMEYLRQNGFLGGETPELLRNTILFCFWKLFCIARRARTPKPKNEEFSAIITY